MLDVQKIRDDFPILGREVNGHPLVYMDNAATTQKPRQVIQALVDYYENFNNDISITNHYHEFCLNLSTDPEGNFYFIKVF